MLKVGIGRVKPDKVQRCRDWFAELMRRKKEVRETFAQETVRHEQAFLFDVGEHTILIYAIEADDPEKAHEASGNSTLPIDIEHKRIMKEITAEKITIEPIYDCAME